MTFLALFVSLPTKASTGRMRVWRALKSIGCATLRDGVYLLPESSEHAIALKGIAIDALEAQGNAEVYCLSGTNEAQRMVLQTLFDRSEGYSAIIEEAKTLQTEMNTLGDAIIGRRMQSLHRHFEQVVRVDFFPGESQRQTLAVLDNLRDAVSRHLSPDEPTPNQVAIARLDPADYHGRTWATRARPWMDRLASAWLIRRHIDRHAHFVWLASPADCQADWLGFDFDGAVFSHVGNKVTFETLLASFGLDTNPTLVKLGELVHCLDIGGIPVAEAPGIEALLSGLRAAQQNDNTLLDEASSIFDWLSRNYEEKSHD